MPEYISREAVLNHLNDIWLTATPTDGRPDINKRLAAARAEGIRDAMDAAEALPAADVVEVVRCRDCIYAPSGPESGGFALEWPYDDWPEDNPCPCKCEDGWYSHKPKPDFYCASGERKERGQDDG